MSEPKEQNNDKDIQAEGGREGWKVDEVSAEASQIDEDEVQRRMNRGDESQGDPNERDHAGTINSGDTPQGREEAKNDTKENSNTNG